ncbi:uncharacterized protein Z518_00526 [Rhinocladiella mackenziei CBS 650.93]|uniref:Transcription factor domain-containing protein n=1 Tax=Rhinocladiella mackenziei CBS 650.93 TaxID=1442369 RepID=A0A0D2J185_9EURO|nr:uncharacterized protein Z518_00526 [Rhinocladiella mackenziei CBS 650.93]KIX09446.1 hypothetical protein Z518_00526 [Rhinocladiella mackenziei CBS 650.93]
MSQIHFVHETKPGSSLGHPQVRALRSHVRKINLERSHQQSTQRLENFRSLTVTDFHSDRKIRSGRRKSSLQSDPLQSFTTESGSSSSGLHRNDSQRSSDRPQNSDAPTRAFESLLSSDSDILPKRCCVSHSASLKPPLLSSGQPPRDGDSCGQEGQHPYASQISVRTQIDPVWIDHLLKSCAFQVAAEPLFVANHFNKDLTTLSVFPGCLENSAFLYAFLYSLLRLRNGGRSTSESLKFKGRAIRLLQEDLEKDDPTLRALSIGTILILCGIAHRAGDTAEHSTHAKGLSKLLQLCRARGLPLRSEVLRAIFWQHLLGAALVGDRQRFYQHDFSAIFRQTAGFLSESSQGLPVGFTCHRQVISEDIISCICEIVHLQTLIAAETVDQTTVNDLQTSIESRLIFPESPQQEPGPIAECCRISVYIVCYMSSTSTWNSSFVPLRLAEKLLVMLDESSNGDLWVSRRDLLLWLLLVGVSVSRGQNCFAAALTSQYQRLLTRTAQEAKCWVDVQHSDILLQAVTEGFIYAQHWVAERHTVPEWVQLEKVLAQGNSDEHREKAGGRG